MQGNQAVIDYMNELLSGELAARDQYFIHSRLYSEWGYTKLFERLNHEMEEETTHAEYFIRRILMLGGTPENKFSEYLKVAKVKEISGITCGGEAVEHIIETYSYLIGEERKVIELANEASDDATADLMTGYLKEQEKMVWMLVAFSTKSCKK